MREESLRFENAAGLGLVGILLRPDGTARSPVVVFAHGWGSSKASPRNRAIAEALVGAGIAAFLFDFTGHGDSEGSAEESTLEDQAADLSSALDLLAARPDLGPIGVAGSSSGGAVAVAVAAREPRVKALVLRAPSDAAERRLAARIEAPTLVVQGERDSLHELNRALVESLHCEHRLCSVPRAGHLFDEPGTFDVALRETLSWFRQHLAGARENAGGVRHAAGRKRMPERATTHFRDRAEAGRLLARKLEHLRGADALVLALPRGGIDVAEPIAKALDADLDVFVSRKIRAPDQPELAIGAIAEGDVVLWNDAIVRSLRLGAAARKRALALARRDLEERVAAYRAVVPRAPLAGRTLVVADDGVATGATLKAALKALHELGPARLVVALPGGPGETLDEIRGMHGVDEVVALATPAEFWAVGQLYDSFEQVSTEAVCAALRRFRGRRGASNAAPARGRPDPRRG
jgi:predicted phosphoribosyltransferase/pimeloyl-ACP methyl ester carboxylesterase